LYFVKKGRTVKLGKTQKEPWPTGVVGETQPPRGGRIKSLKIEGGGGKIWGK